jgi:hypothetical protein
VHLVAAHDIEQQQFSAIVALGAQLIDALFLNCRIIAQNLIHYIY